MPLFDALPASEVTEVTETEGLSESCPRAHNPKVVGSNPTPATI